MVLVRQYRHAVGRSVLEIPGGAVDPADGDPLRAAQRELAEGTGYAAPDWRMLGSFFPNPATHTSRVHVTLALRAHPAATSLDVGEEALATLTLPVREVLDGLVGGLLG